MPDKPRLRVPPTAAANASPTAAAVPAVARGLALLTTPCPQAAAAEEPFDSDPAAVLPCVRAFPSSFLKPFYPCNIIKRAEVCAVLTPEQLAMVVLRTPSVSFYLSLRQEILVYFSAIVWSERLSIKI
jgi:hypothetical protein